MSEKTEPQAGRAASVAGTRHAAGLDELLSEIEDAPLRAAFKEKIRDLREGANLGLVFERHLPESVLLSSDVGLAVGDRVQLRAEVHSGRQWRVVSLDKDRAVVRGPDNSEQDVSLGDLLVVKDFGNPIYPTLTSLGAERRGGDKPHHLVINGENFHALELLGFTHAGKVDCIYIDPPYNTGARDWKYNNAYVDDNDVWRHSKWLSFIEKRLRLAERLLKPDSVLIVTVDEHEIHHLGMLLEELFSDAVRQLVTIVVNPLGQARKQELARVEEYAFFVFRGEAAPTAAAEDFLTERPKTTQATKVRWERLIRGGTGARRQDSPRLFYPVFVDPQAHRIAEIGTSLPLEVKPDEVSTPKGLVAAWPINTNGQEGRWRCSPAYLRSLTEKGYAKVGDYDSKNDRYSILYLGKAQIQRIESGEIEIAGRDENGVVILEQRERDQRRVTPKTVWNRRSHRAGEYGSGLIKKFVPGIDFPFPKSVYAVLDTLRIACGNNRDALILDFFAGSGTTLHSTLLLNAEDNGRRQAIIVTNNEVDAATAQKLARRSVLPCDPEHEASGIFEAVARPRIEAALTGSRSDGSPVPGSYLGERDFADGFDENVEFFRLDYLNSDRIELGQAQGALEPLLWLIAGASGRRPDRLPQEPYVILAECGFAVLFDESSLSDFVAALATVEDVRHVFLFTDYDDAFSEMAAALGTGRTTHMLPRDYLRKFRLNIGGR